MFKQNLVANTGAWQGPKYASANIALVLKIVFVKEKRNGTVRAFFFCFKMKNLPSRRWDKVLFRYVRINFI